MVAGRLRFGCEGAVEDQWPCFWGHGQERLHLNNTTKIEKGKSSARERRKATGLHELAEPPK